MKETLLLTKHMREFPEDSHQIEIYEKNILSYHPNSSYFHQYHEEK